MHPLRRTSSLGAALATFLVLGTSGCDSSTWFAPPGDPSAAIEVAAGASGSGALDATFTNTSLMVITFPNLSPMKVTLTGTGGPVQLDDPCNPPIVLPAVLVLQPGDRKTQHFQIPATVFDCGAQTAVPGGLYGVTVTFRGTVQNGSQPTQVTFSKQVTVLWTPPSPRPTP